jgi:hypothetical protein
VESTNKVLETILTKTIYLHHKDWTDRLPEELWAYQTTWRNTIGFTPYELVYGNNIVLPIEFQIKTLRTVMKVGSNLSEAKRHRLERINELDEMRQDSLQHTTLIQQQREKWHDKFIKKNRFKLGD